MTWKCPKCGNENSVGERHCIGLCGYVQMAAMVVLTSAATGKRLRMHVSTPVGQSLLRTIADAEAAYASEPQFEILKDQALGVWTIRHSASAHNPTYINGARIDIDTPSLADGTQITIGRERMKLTVSLEEV